MIRSFPLYLSHREEHSLSAKSRAPHPTRSHLRRSSYARTRRRRRYWIHMGAPSHQRGQQGTMRGGTAPGERTPPGEPARSGGGRVPWLAWEGGEEGRGELGPVGKGRTALGLGFVARCRRRSVTRGGEKGRSRACGGDTCPSCCDNNGVTLGLPGLLPARWGVHGAHRAAAAGML